MDNKIKNFEKIVAKDNVYLTYDFADFPQFYEGFDVEVSEFVDDVQYFLKISTSSNKQVDAKSIVFSFEKNDPFLKLINFKKLYILAFNDKKIATSFEITKIKA